MFAHLLVAVILTLGVVVFGYKYLTSSYLKNHPTKDAGSVKAVLGLPVLQFGIWAMAFIPLWAFLPTHPKYDGGEAFLSSDLANWEIFKEVANLGDGLYLMQTLLGIGFIIFGGISISILFSLIKQKIYSDSTVKTLSIIDTVFSALAAWNILVTVVGALVDILFRGLAPAAFITIFILVNIVLVWWIIRKAIRMQKSFNAHFATFDNNSDKTPAGTMNATKKCPYCGEEILAVAKKCKHCGEWIKEEDVVVEVKKKTCPVCGEEIDAAATICPICHETIGQSKNAFHEKMMTRGKDSSESKIYHNGCFWILIVAAIAIIIAVCVGVFPSKDSSESNDSSAEASDSIEVVEEEPIVVEEDNYNYYNEEGMIQHSEEQGQYEDDNTIHSLNEYNGY